MMRQKVRKTLLFIAFLLFPVTCWYFSPYLIIGAAMEHAKFNTFSKADYDELYNTGAAAREKRIARFNDVMYGDDNTFYHVIKKKKNVLAKASTIEGSNALANFAENPVAAAEIKGINRNAVSIELKSAGNANISIMNIDGVVVAKISKENLQQGVYNIKWNSESIPNGRYIVAVKHNGLFSAKNVILK